MSHPDQILKTYLQTIFDHLDSTPDVDEKRRHLTMIITVWNNLVPQIAAYTNVSAEHQAQARTNITNQLNALQEVLKKQ